MAFAVHRNLLTMRTAGQLSYIELLLFCASCRTRLGIEMSLCHQTRMYIGLYAQKSSQRRAANSVPRKVKPHDRCPYFAPLTGKRGTEITMPLPRPKLHKCSEGYRQFSPGFATLPVSADITDCNQSHSNS